MYTWKKKKGKKRERIEHIVNQIRKKFIRSYSLARLRQILENWNFLSSFWIIHVRNKYSLRINLKFWHEYFSLSLSLSLYIYIYLLSLYLSIYPSLSLPLFLSLPLYIYIYIYLLSLYLSIYPSLSLPLFLSLPLYIYISIYPLSLLLMPRIFLNHIKFSTLLNT